VRRDPETPVSDEDHRITVDEKLVRSQKKIYLMMNKPRGLVTTASDEHGRETIYTLLNQASAEEATQSAALPWVAPVGRLDKASEGLLLLTNDSEWGARITDPATRLDKTYHVQVDAFADEGFLKSLLAGMRTKEGEMLSAKQARLLRSGNKNCWVEIVLDEGKNRHIRRMVEAKGIEVLRLIRIAIGPVQLGDLAKGGHRALTAHEKSALDRAMRGNS
jgi:23S rRNA pseudouridine2605 synthase